MEEKKENNLELTQEDANDLLSEFNKRGYLLEDKTYEVLNNHIQHNGIEKNQLGIEYEKKTGERVEFDVLLKTNMKIFVIDAKRTTYDWIFSPSLNKGKSLLNLICLHPKRGYVSVPMNLDEDSPIKTANHDFAVEFDGEKLSRKDNKNSLVLPRDGFRPIHDAVRKVLKQSKAILLEGKKYISDYKFVIPLVVTNGRLLYMNYKPEKIIENGDLTEIDSLVEAKAIAYNFNESFGINGEQGLGSSRPENITKTVIIVNIKHLKEIVEHLKESYLKVDFRTDKKHFTSKNFESDDSKSFWETN